MSNENKDPKNTSNIVGSWIAIGAGIGVSLGIVFNNLPIGIALGAGVGVVMGAVLAQKKQ